MLKSAEIRVDPGVTRIKQQIELLKASGESRHASLLAQNTLLRAIHASLSEALQPIGSPPSSEQH